MQRSTAIVGTLATVLALSATLPVMAQPAGDRDARPDRHEHNEHGQRQGRQRLSEFLELYDTNGDGDITQEEVDAVRADRLAEFDADQDGQLSLAEYEALWLDAMRERMVDRFQSHDDDGDGQVTVDEFGENFANLVDRADRNDDGVLNEDDQRRPDGPRGADAETEEE